MIIKKILVPTDFSDCSINALKYAIYIAEKFGAKITVAHAYTFPATFSDIAIPDLYESARKEANNRFKMVKESVPELEPLLDEFILDHAIIMDVVGYIERTKKMDLIVMGTKGASGLSEALVGSVAFDVVKNAQCPVFVVPENTNLTYLKSMAIAADYENVSNRETFEPAMSLARVFNAEVHIMNVSKSSYIGDREVHQAKKFEQYFKNIPHNYHFEIEQDIEEGINSYLSDNEVDLLILIRREHKLIERLFNKNITKKMVFHTDVPLLVIPDQTVD